MEQGDREGYNQAFITIRIRIGHCDHMMKTNNMVSFQHQVAVAE